MKSRAGRRLFISVVFFATVLFLGAAELRENVSTGNTDPLGDAADKQEAGQEIKATIQGNGTMRQQPGSDDPPEPPRLIAHAGGEFHGIRLTNSLQALNNSYEKGFRYFELDMNWTRDHVPVLVHDWGNSNWFADIRHSTEPQLYFDFIKSRTILDMQRMDLDSLETWCSVHRDAKVISDGKSENVELLQRIKEKYPSLFVALIPQAYSFEEYEDIKKLGYLEIILSLYRLEKECSEVVLFCRRNPLFGVAIYENMATCDLLNKLNEENVKTFIHTVNDYDRYIKLREDGAYGAFTDFLQPGSWVE